MICLTNRSGSPLSVSDLNSDFQAWRYYCTPRNEKKAHSLPSSLCGFSLHILCMPAAILQICTFTFYRPRVMAPAANLNSQQFSSCLSHMRDREHSHPSGTFAAACRSAYVSRKVVGMFTLNIAPHQACKEHISGYKAVVVYAMISTADACVHEAPSETDM